MFIIHFGWSRLLVEQVCFQVCVKSMSNFMFCYDINYGDIMFCEYNFLEIMFGNCVNGNNS